MKQKFVKILEARELSFTLLQLLIMCFKLKPILIKGLRNTESDFFPSNIELARLARLATWCLCACQSDQMAKLSFQYLAVYSKENLPNFTKKFQSGLKFCEIQSEPSKTIIFPKVVKFHQIWSHWYLLAHSEAVGLSQ